MVDLSEKRRSTLGFLMLDGEIGRLQEAMRHAMEELGAHECERLDDHAELARVILSRALDGPEAPGDGE